MAKKQMKKILEADLYQPIYDYLTEQGYSVYSEVKNCDIAAVKGEELVVVELKRGFNATLLIQATKRQRAADSVYVGIPKPKNRAYSRDWNDMCHLLRRLELGLIVVTFEKGNALVEVIQHPAPFTRINSSKGQRHSIIREVSGRHGDYNIGGSFGKKLMTAYRENAMFVACCLDRFGPLSPKEIRELGTGKRTSSILQKNFYGWFERIATGKYALHPDGKKYLEGFPELVVHYNDEIEKAMISRIPDKPDKPCKPKKAAKKSVNI